MKVRLARLQLEAWGKAQVRKDTLQHQLEKYCIEAVGQLELQGKQKEIGLENSLYVDSFVCNANSVAVTTDSVNPVSVSTSVLSDSPSAVIFNVAKNIALVLTF